MGGGKEEENYTLAVQKKNAFTVELEEKGALAVHKIKLVLYALKIRMKMHY